MYVLCRKLHFRESAIMEFLAYVCDLVHGFADAFIIAIIVITTMMSIFLYKIIYKSDFFSSYDRNL